MQQSEIEAPAESAGLRLAELIGSLSLATDLAMGQPMEHALRSCLLAVAIAREAGLADPELRTTYYLALLRFIGCTADSEVAAAAFGDEITARTWSSALDFSNSAEVFGATFRHHGAGQPPLQRAGRILQLLRTAPKMKDSTVAHCEVAQRLAERLGLGPDVQQALWHAYEFWNGQGFPGRVKGDQIAVPARVMLLAHDLEIILRSSGQEDTLEIVRRRAGRVYDPDLADLFCRRASHLSPVLEVDSAWSAVLAIEPRPWARLSAPELDTAVRAIADFVDLKSPYLAGHSTAVADLAAAAGRAAKLPAGELTVLWRAGLLHDLGRVGITTSIWGKPKALTESEWERVRLHPYYTERILARSRPLAPIAAVAALHHERLDGSGYHRGATASGLSTATRILAAADAYAARLEPRPHRPALTPDQAAGELQQEARAARLDRAAVEAVLSAAGHQVRPARRQWPAGLSEREVEVLRLVARGLSNRQMAGALTISERTVHHHVQHIYDKTGVSTRAAATFFAMQHDLVGAQTDAPAFLPK